MSAASSADPHDPVLVLPGLGNSDAGHWQSLWQAAHANFQRVAQTDWERPVRSEWQRKLEAAVASFGPRSVLAAHSLGCLLTVHWAASTHLAVRGALLVGVPNPERPNFPPQIVGFSPLPMRPLPFPSILVASTNDSYGSFDYARGCAQAWGSRLVSLGAAGHINTASGYGEWPEGWALLETLTSI